MKKAFKLRNVSLYNRRGTVMYVLSYITNRTNVTKELPLNGYTSQPIIAGIKAKPLPAIQTTGKNLVFLTYSYFAFLSRYHALFRKVSIGSEARVHVLANVIFNHSRSTGSVLEITKSSDQRPNSWA